jgi:hypothetical protein
VSPVCYLDSPEVDPAYVWAGTDQSPFADSRTRLQNCGGRAALRAIATEGAMAKGQMKSNKEKKKPKKDKAAKAAAKPAKK